MDISTCSFGPWLKAENHHILNPAFVPKNQPSLQSNTTTMDTTPLNKSTITGSSLESESPSLSLSQKITEKPDGDVASSHWPNNIFSPDKSLVKMSTQNPLDNKATHPDDKSIAINATLFNHCTWDEKSSLWL